MAISSINYNPTTKPKTYLFVDGSNFRQYFNQITQIWFEQEVEFDFGRIKKYFGAEKAFYYDCIDDVKNDHENNNQYEQRINSQEEKLNKIREVEGCHVYLGSLSGKGKKKRQKEVDVLLAVQMMEHALRGNMSKAVLLSGDKDFRPLVESLIRLGLFVEVSGDKNHISKDLIHSADSHKKLSIDQYFDWADTPLKQQHPLEIKRLSFFIHRADEDSFHLKKKGKCNDKDVYIFIGINHKGYWLTTSDKKMNDNSAWVDNNLEKLELYFNLKYGNIIWD